MLIINANWLFFEKFVRIMEKINYDYQKHLLPTLLTILTKKIIRKRNKLVCGYYYSGYFSKNHCYFQSFKRQVGSNDYYLKVIKLFLQRRLCFNVSKNRSVLFLKLKLQKTINRWGILLLLLKRFSLKEVLEACFYFFTFLLIGCIFWHIYKLFHSWTG